MRGVRRKWLMAALPFIFGFLLFYVLPFGYSVRYSLMESAFSDRFVGLQNYANVISGPYYRLALRNTLRLIGLGVPAIMLVALALALAVYKLNGRCPWARAAILLPLLMPSAALVPAFEKLDLGVQLPVYAIYVWKNAGFLMVLLVAALSAIPRELYEAAALDGAHGRKKFLSITLPQLAPALFFAFVLAVVYNLRIFREVYLLYGAYPERPMYLMQHYMNNHYQKLNYQNLTAGAILFAAMAYLFVGIAYKLDRRLEIGR